MLREIKSIRNRPYLLGGSALTANPNFTLSIGNDELTNLVYVGTGRGSFSTRNVFSQIPAFHGTNGPAGTSGGGFSIQSAVTATTAEVRNNTTAGAAVDGGGNFLLAGLASRVVTANSNVGNFAARSVLRGQFERPVLATARITGTTGAIVFGSNWITCTRASQGIYNFTFKRGFGQTPLVYAQAIVAGTGLRPQVSSSTATGCTVIVLDSAPAVQDCDLYLWVYGSLSKDSTGRHFNPVMTPMRKPRFLFTAITTSAGVPAFSFANVDNLEFGASITDNGAGDYTISFSSSFKREPAILVGSQAVTTVHTTTTSSVRVQNHSYGGGLSDVTDPPLYLMVLGSDDATEYGW